MKLAQVINAEDTVLFIGAGASIWSGLPSWGKLLSELCEYMEANGINSNLVRLEISRGDLLQAASYGFDRLTKHQVGDFVRTACRYGVAQPSELHDMLAQLGPRCFVTTNYDDLIERALHKWRRGVFRPPITNRHLIETAEIVHARAVDFIYKPHGDASDAESIVLTREQYRTLLPGGERQAALESLKMLLVSRPVIYVGFGLRDPDFLYLRDILSNIYKGGIRDHYALMADVSEEEVGYWRRSYGVHLITYATTAREDGTRDHSGLLDLLRELAREDAPPAATEESLDFSKPEIALTLARHAAALARIPKQLPEFPVLVQRQSQTDGPDSHQANRFIGRRVEKLLDLFEGKIVLVGLPGTGKSYALRQAAARLAEKLHSACLSESSMAEAPVIPIFVDLKLYEGDISRLVADALPANLELKEMLKVFSMKIFLDSFNEMPRRYLESGQGEADFKKFFKEIGSVPVVVGSRTTDGLIAFGFTAYELNEIEEGTVKSELSRRGGAIQGRFANEIYALLRRPFYFRYVLSGKILLPEHPRPGGFYKSLIGHFDRAFLVKFGADVGIANLLRAVAYQALNAGEEAFPLANLLRAIEVNTAGTALENAKPLEIANWFVSAELLIPYSGERMAFVHQSITEYLAASELALIFRRAPNVLREKIKLRRWDQALFLTLNELEDDQAGEFFRAVLDADLVLALSAAKFVEDKTEEVVQKLLEELLIRLDALNLSNYSVQMAMRQGLPVTPRHATLLRQIIHSQTELAGPAAELLIDIEGERVKDELLEFIRKVPIDYNLCANHIGPGLKKFATLEDLEKVATWAEIFDDVGLDDRSAQAFVSGVASFLNGLSLACVANRLMPRTSDELHSHPIRTKVLNELLGDVRSTAALAVALDLLMLGSMDAVTAIYFIVSYSHKEEIVDCGIIREPHIDKLIEIYIANADLEAARWILEAVERICEKRPDLSVLVNSRLDRIQSPHRLALSLCVAPKAARQAIIFEVLRNVVTGGGCDVKRLDALDIDGLDWKGNEGLILDLLRMRDASVASAVLGNGIPADLAGLGVVDLGDVSWWLDWIQELFNSDEHDLNWVGRQISSFIAGHADKQGIRRILNEFNSASSKYRQILAEQVLSYFHSLTTDDLSEDAIGFSIGNLIGGRSRSYLGHFLGAAATEAFVLERLLPLFAELDNPQAKRLRAVLDAAGSRHGKRY